MKALVILTIPFFLFFFKDSSCKERKEAKRRAQIEATQQQEKEEVKPQIKINEKDMDIKVSEPKAPTNSKPSKSLEEINLGTPNQPNISKAEMQELEANTSDCIKEKIQVFVKNNSSMSMAQVFAFKSKGTTYYMFDEGMALDAPAYVLNNRCDTVCVTGGMRRGPSQDTRTCPEEEGERIVIWNPSMSK